MRALRQREIEGPVEMLHLLRFREVADASRSPEPEVADSRLLPLEPTDRVVPARTG